jgi:rare lipoprotein A
MKRVLLQALAIAVTVASLGAAPVRKHNSSSSATSTGSKPSRPYQVGPASWYGKSFDGRETASGERYNMFLLTAAHRELPLGTLVRVTNLRNGRAVVVRINDRGPVPKSRIIDLSYGAAQLLGLRAHGVTKVRLDLVPEDATVVAENNPETVQEK